MGAENYQNIEEKKPAQQAVIFSGKVFDFLEKKKNWILSILMIILLVFLSLTVYDYFQIGEATAEFNVAEIKIQAKELDKMEEYRAAKNALLSEKKQRNYRDLFR